MNALTSQPSAGDTAQNHPEDTQILVRVTIGTEEWRGTLAEFFRDNEDGIDHEGRRIVRDTLSVFGSYKGGGGAAESYLIECEPPTKGQL